MKKITKLTFRKEYTRDTSLIIQESWPLSVLGSELLGVECPYDINVIHYMSDGVIECWEEEKVTKWYMDELLKKNKTGFFDKIFKEYNEILNKMEFYWKKETISDIKELDEFIKYMLNAMKYFTIMYFTGVDERTPEDVRKKALSLRNTDVFFDNTDKLIRKSLLTIYPKLKGFETTIIYKEVEDLPDMEILKKRKENCVMISGQYLKIETLEEFMKKHKDYNFIIEKVEEKDELKGRSAFGGRVQGKVRVLKRKEQIEELQQGEILVSAMTTPDFVPAMKKAAGIVTDEGGVTCHAAIVSRELKKPCVIGTRIATKVLKDGDLVEVDADKGIVRVLNKG